MTLCSSFTIPFYCLRCIFCHTLSVSITHAEEELRVGIPLFRSFTIPFYCLRCIFYHALS